MQLRSGSIIAPKKSSTPAPKVAVVSTMRLRSGRVIGYKNVMNGEVPFTKSASATVSVEDKTTDLAYVIKMLMKNITATHAGSKEENALTKTEYLESIVSVITQNMDFMLNASKWPYFLKIAVPKMLQFADDMHYYLNESGYRFSDSQRAYLKKMMRKLVKISFTVEMKLAAKK
jgi:hypothetical protein